MFLGIAPIIRNVKRRRYIEPAARWRTDGASAAIDSAPALDAAVEGRWDDAEMAITSDRQAAMNDAAFLNLLGIVRQAKGQWKEARRCYGKAIKADRHYTPAEQNLRRVYELHTFGRTDLEISLIDSETAIELESRFAPPLMQQCLA